METNEELNDDEGSVWNTAFEILAQKMLDNRGVLRMSMDE